MSKRQLSEEEIDELVVAQANDDQAWDAPIQVRPAAHSTSIRLSSEMIQRAKFFAQLHGQRGYQSWLKEIINERIQSEERMFTAIKRDVLAKGRRKTAG